MHVHERIHVHRTQLHGSNINHFMRDMMHAASVSRHARRLRAAGLGSAGVGSAGLGSARLGSARLKFHRRADSAHILARQMRALEATEIQLVPRSAKFQRF